MEYFSFDGQQTGEKILCVITPHTFRKYFAIGKLFILSLFLIGVTFMIGTIIPEAKGLLLVVGICMATLLLTIGSWWNTTVFTKDKTFLTDRRIIRFDVVSPFLTTKRALFWNEIMKAKAYAPNMLYKMIHVGSVTTEPIMADHENITITDVFMYEDIGNYIDKILYIVKNKPSELQTIRPFVAKPKGQRG